ncbi:MAG: hypothetical protein Kow0099_05850 [Candidatus Abyssubacteria bacterium]
MELFVPPKYSEGEGLVALRRALEEMSGHPVARMLEFASCHFPWGERANGYSRYNLIDHQYFYPFCEIAGAFHDFCREIGLPPERAALNFHNLYELPRSMLARLKTDGKLAALREMFLEHALAQTLTANAVLNLLGLSLTLVNENNPPIGDGDRMSVVDVFAEDTAVRASKAAIRACLDLSHFFMTKFYFETEQPERPPFPYLELESEDSGRCRRQMTFEEYVETLRPLYFHVSDTKRPGTCRTVEGLPIGTGDTPWEEVLQTLAHYASRNDDGKIFLMIELKGGHTSEGTELCRTSEEKLRANEAFQRFNND